MRKNKPLLYLIFIKKHLPISFLPENCIKLGLLFFHFLLYSLSAGEKDHRLLNGQIFPNEKNKDFQKRKHL